MGDQQSADISGQEPSTDELFATLAGETRRQVLRYFQTSEEHDATLDELAVYLVAQDGGVDDPERAEIILYHQDLPKLEEYGFIEYVAETGQITPTERTQEIGPMLELAE